jgi:hypothetical protein
MHSSPLAAIRSRLAFLGNPLPREGLRAGFDYLRRHPGVILTTARNAAGLRLTVPIEALRWLVEHMPPSKKAPRDVALGTAPPALSVAATSELMGNAFRAGADVTVEDVRASTDELVVTLRVDNLSLKALGAQDSPMANLFKAMDMSNPAGLLAMMPGKSPALIEAKKNRFVVDFLKIPKIASNPLVRRALEVVTPLLEIADVRTEGDLLTIGLKTKAGGLAAALAALRGGLAR